jgi:hypothetical protein
MTMPTFATVEKLAPATARAAEPIVSLCLYLCSEDPDSAGMLPENAGATGPPVSRAGERRGEDFCCGLTKDLESRLAARGNIEEDPRRREAARAKGSGGK